MAVLDLVNSGAVAGARGQLALDDLDFDRARQHFLASRLLKLKPRAWSEVAPLPQPVLAEVAPPPRLVTVKELVVESRPRWDFRA